MIDKKGQAYLLGLLSILIIVIAILIMIPKPTFYDTSVGKEILLRSALLGLLRYNISYTTNALLTNQMFSVSESDTNKLDISSVRSFMMMLVDDLTIDEKDITIKEKSESIKIGGQNIFYYTSIEGSMSATFIDSEFLERKERINVTYNLTIRPQEQDELEIKEDEKRPYFMYVSCAFNLTRNGIPLHSARVIVYTINISSNGLSLCEPVIDQVMFSQTGEYTINVLIKPEFLIDKENKNNDLGIMVVAIDGRGEKVWFVKRVNMGK
jgi:hypothetical protein